MFCPINIRKPQRSRRSQIDRAEALESLLNLIEDTDSEAYREHYKIWTRDRLWETQHSLSDDEIDQVCDDYYLEEKYRFVENYAKAHSIKLREI